MILEKITGSDAVFDTLPDRNEKITYDLLRLIKDGKPVMLMSDRKTCIAAQTNADLPVWIFLKSMPDDRLSAELCSIISYAVAANPALHVQSDERFIKAVLDPVGKPYRLHMKMNAYACRKPAAVRLSGNMIPASEKYRSDIKRLLCEMVHDSVGEDPDEAGANGFADYAISSGNVFLWEDGGKIASMVNVASRTSDNCAAEYRCHRKGYARQRICHNAYVGAVRKAAVRGADSHALCRRHEPVFQQGIQKSRI